MYGPTTGKNRVPMKPLPLLLLGLLGLSACSTLRETAVATDDVYDVPDRSVVTQTRTAARGEATNEANDDYYNPAESERLAQRRDYYDLTYNDPYYYNYGRFGFGAGVSSFGPSYGMGIGYGWPTSFGSMSVYYGSGLAGYNPYWGNSWMSGYGYSPYGYSPYDPFGYYGYGRYGMGYGGYGMGYGPYYSPWGRCFGCYEPVGYNNIAYGHRPSMSAGSGPAPVAAPTPRMMRNPASLMPDATRNAPPRMESPANERKPQRLTAPAPRSTDHNLQREPAQRTPRQESRPNRNWGLDSAPSPSRSTGGSFGGRDGGGGRITSPRPR